MMKPDSLYNCGMKPLVYSEGIAKNKSKKENSLFLTFLQRLDGIEMDMIFVIIKTIWREEMLGITILSLLLSNLSVKRTYWLDFNLILLLRWLWYCLLRPLLPIYLFRSPFIRQIHWRRSCQENKSQKKAIMPNNRWKQVIIRIF